MSRPESIETEGLRRDATRIVLAAIAGVDPRPLVVRALTGEFNSDTPVRLVAAGKAAVAMARGAVEVLGQQIVDGVVISPEPADLPGFRTVPGGHPIPTSMSVVGGRLALELAASVREGEELLCLLSGGASALMAVPADGISLEEKRATVDQLLRFGADITSLNTVRKHLSAIKGGALAQRSASGCRTLAISDVVGDNLGVIGSGPGVADPSSYSDALAVLDRCGGRRVFASTVVARLTAGARGEIAETLKPQDARAGRIHARVIGGRRDAMTAAHAMASAIGYHVVIIDEPIVGDARSAVSGYVERLRAELARGSGPLCVVSSGETTVRVTGGGIGGRNQEFALATASGLADSSPCVLASVGTDGVDGPTDAAGAFVDSTTLARARASGLDATVFLDNNDSHSFFRALGDLIITGPTGTNVGDLQIFLSRRSAPR